MATITLSISDATADEQRAAAYILDRVNAKRASMDPPLVPFTNMNELTVDHLQKVLFPKWIRMEADDRASQEDMITKFREADDTTRQQIFELLNG